MEILHTIYTEIGPWGLLLIVLVFIVLRGQFSFRYPRNPEKPDN